MLLIHLNGPPGVGKSVLARRYVDEHPLSLLLDIDALRTSLGRWREVDGSKLVARELALALAEAHLRNGHDVVVPQYVGRIDFIAALDDVARRAGVHFVEILMSADHSVSVERFLERRREFRERGADHPEADVDDAVLGATIAEASGRLTDVASSRQGTLTIDANGDVERTYRELIEAVRRSHPAPNGSEATR